MSLSDAYRLVFFSSSVYFLFIYSSDGIHDTFVIAFLELFLLRKQGFGECIFKGDRAIFWFFLFLAL